MVANAAQYPNPWTKQLNFPMTAGTVLEIGDLVIVQSSKAVPAGSATDQGSEAANQAYAAPKFVGVSAMRKLSTDTDTVVDVELEWVGLFTCASATFVVGDYVTFCENGGTNGLETAKLKKTTNPAIAIGQVLLDYASATTTVFVRLSSNFLRKSIANDLPNGIQGLDAGYKIARGQATTATASDTVVTGLATVVAVVANLESAPVIGCDRGTGAIGDQAGTPAAGSILIQTWKPTASGDATPIAATTFSKKVNWIAIGT